jgi:acetate kinase
MNGLDSLVFTAGIGENSDVVRELVCENLSFLGIEIDLNKNRNPQKFGGDISSRNSKVSILVIPTNEEQEIANQSFSLISEYV